MARKPHVALLWPDTHGPYEDKVAYGLALDVGLSLGSSLKEIVLLGDFGDLYPASQYAKHPDLGDAAFLWEEQVDWFRFRLGEMRRLFPHARIKFLEGNHEARIGKYLLGNAPMLRRSYSFTQAAGIDSVRNLQWIPFGEKQSVRVLETPLYARHCPVLKMGGTAESNAARAGCSFAYGHTHKLGFASATSQVSGEQHFALNCGHLADLASPQIFDYYQGWPNWTQGFGLVWDWSRGVWDFDLVRIRNGEALSQGKLFRG